MNTVPTPRVTLRVYVALLIAMAIAVSVWRLSTFNDIDLRADQASTMVWLQNIHDAERLLPTQLPGEGWLNALEADERSLLNVVLKPIYTGNQQIFMIVTVGLLAMVTFVVGAEFATQLGVTVMVAGLIIVAVGLFPLALQGVNRGRAMAIGAASALIVALDSFLSIFSAFSVHNMAVAAMVGALAVVACWIGREDQRHGLTWAVIASLIAIYSNHANVLLVPTTAVIATLVAGGAPLRSRAMRVVRYSCWIFFGMLPSVLLIIVTKIHGLGFPNKQDFDALWLQAFTDPSGGYWARLGDRAWGWFLAMDQVFSGAGLLLAFAGLTVLAVRYRVRVPLVLVSIHFLLSVMLPIVTQYDRTAAYVVPMLALGAGTAVVEAVAALKSKDGRLPGPAVVLSLVTAMFLAGHATRDVPRLVNPERAFFWGNSLDSRGQQLAMTAEIEQLLPRRAQLVPLNTAIGQRFQAQRRRSADEITIFKPLDLLGKRARAGVLDAYIRDRRLVLEKTIPVYVLASDSEPVSATRAHIAATLCHSALARCKKARLDEIARWPQTQFMLGRPILYRLVDD